VTQAGHDELEQVLTGALQPPMSNGEVVFDAPWQSRVFGMAVALHEAETFRWEEFQQCLIEAISVWQTHATDSDVYPYYELFQVALQQLLADKGLLAEHTLASRTMSLAQRPAGHDHAHHHHH